jgi:hypothetical protein
MNLIRFSVVNPIQRRQASQFGDAVTLSQVRMYPSSNSCENYVTKTAFHVALAFDAAFLMSFLMPFTFSK